MSDSPDIKKFCKNCRHLKRAFIVAPDTWECEAPTLYSDTELDMVSGELLLTYTTNKCKELRRPAEICGPDGSLYEAAEHYTYVSQLLTDSTSTSKQPRSRPLTRESDFI